jgi:tetratricopeptide (TPR) repeat protein
MMRSAKVLVLLVLAGSLIFAQAPAPTPQPTDNKAAAYYNFAMGRVYAELAQAYGNRPEYLNKALQHYQEALKLDPTEGIIFEELTDLYIQTNRLRDAVTQAEDMLKQNPDNIDARRMLGRIYMRMLSTSDNRINEEYLKKAIEQLEMVTAKDPKDAESWVMLGRLYGASNNSVASEKAYNQALAADPESEDALTGLATLYASLGDSKRAAEKLKAAADKSPSERTLIALGQAYEDLKDYKNAAEALSRALEMQPDNMRLMHNVAEDLVLSDQLDAALPIFLKLSEDPRNLPAKLRVAEIYRIKRDFTKAREALDKAKAADAESVDIKLEDVRLLDAEGKYSDAINILKGLIDSNAKRNYTANEAAGRAAWLAELGQLYRNAGQYTEAIDSFRKALALSKADVLRIELNIIDTYRLAKDTDAARKEVDAAAAEVRKSGSGKNDYKTLVDLASLYEKGKRWTDMSKVLDEALKAAEDGEQKESVLFMKGAMLERQKKIDASETEFRKVLELNPNHAGALNYLGYMLVDHGIKVDEATKMIQKALEVDPENGAYLDSLGWAFYQQGKLNEAETLLIRALDRIGQDPTVHDHLADVYFKLGKTKEAISQWQASLKDFSSPAGADSEPDDVAKVSRKLDAARLKLAKENK